MNFSLIIPVYHPPEGWEKNLIYFINKLVDEYNHNIELIIVDDGSQLEFNKEAFSVQLSDSISCNFIQYAENNGKGHALKRGFIAASRESAVFTDVDFPYSLMSMQQVLESLEQDDVDVVMGRRTDDYYTQLPAARKVISKSLLIAIKIIFGLAHPQTQVGIKGFNKRGIAVVTDSIVDRYLFDLEVILEAEKQKLNISEVQVELRDGIIFRSMDSSILKKELSNFWSLFRKYRLGI